MSIDTGSGAEELMALITGAERGLSNICCRAYCCDLGVSCFATGGPDSDSSEVSIVILLPFDGTRGESVATLVLCWRGPSQGFLDDGVQVWEVAELVIELAAILRGNVLWVNVFLKGLFHVCLVQDEDFRLTMGLVQRIIVIVYIDLPR